MRACVKEFPPVRGQAWAGSAPGITSIGVHSFLLSNYLAFARDNLFMGGGEGTVLLLLLPRVQGGRVKRTFMAPAPGTMSPGGLGQVPSLLRETGPAMFSSLPNRAVERISAKRFACMQDYIIIAECCFFMNMHERC